MADIIQLATYQNPGNGAREAMMDLLMEQKIFDAKDIPNAADLILLHLWILGFKVVPLEKSDR